jgi:hypothetical protein
MPQSTIVFLILAATVALFAWDRLRVDIAEDRCRARFLHGFSVWASGAAFAP